MKNLQQLKEIIEKNRSVLREQYKVKNIGIFGSYARGEQTEDSDADILVEFSEPVGLLLVHLADYLEEILGVKIDLLTPDGVKPNRKRYVMEDLVYV